MSWSTEDTKYVVNFLKQHEPRPEATGLQPFREVLKRGLDRVRATNADGQTIEVVGLGFDGKPLPEDASYTYEEQEPADLAEQIKKAQDEGRYEDASRLAYNGIRMARDFEALAEDLMDEYDIDVNAPIWELMPEEVTA